MEVSGLGPAERNTMPSPLQPDPQALAKQAVKGPSEKVSRSHKNKSSSSESNIGPVFKTGHEPIPVSCKGAGTTALPQGRGIRTTLDSNLCVLAEFLTVLVFLLAVGKPNPVRCLVCCAVSS